MDKLSIESKLLTVADIFTAMTEKRPYRDVVNEDALTRLLGELVDLGKIDRHIATAAVTYCHELYDLNKLSQLSVLESFDKMEKEKADILSEHYSDTTA